MALFDVIPAELAVIVVVPWATDVARPFDPVTLLMRATVESDEVHVTDAVISCVVESVNVPVAVNCWVFPSAMLVPVGAIAIDTNVAGVTTSVDTGLETTKSNVAVINVVPVAREVTSPFEPAILLIVATPGTDEVHVARVVRSCVAPSTRVPEAVNCFEVPLAMLAVLGEVKMVATGDVESREVPVMPLNVALMIEVPGAAMAIASPDEMPTMAMPVSEESQVAKDVRFCTALFASVPWAENCKDMLGAMLGGFDGVTAIVVTGDVVSTVEPVMALDIAVITVGPVIDPAVASPRAFINAIVSSDELHVADVVRFTLVLFE